MTSPFDRRVWEAFEGSAIVRLFERLARVIKAGASTSRALASSSGWRAAAVRRPGHVILSAAVTHMVLMAAIARPATWQWLILPVIGAAIGIVLIVTSRAPRTEP